MKANRILTSLSLVIVLVGLLVATRLIETPLFAVITPILGRTPTASGTRKLQLLGALIAGLGIASFAFFYFVYPRLPQSAFALRKVYRDFVSLLDRWLGRFFSIGRLDPGSTGSTINRWDWLAIIVFLVFSGLVFLGRVQGNFPDVRLGSDGANIAALAAALDHPELFLDDALLGNLDKLQVYSVIHIPITRALQGLLGNYGLAYAVLLGPHIFFQLLGFYIFGRVLFHSRYWAFLLTVLVAMPVPINLGEAWGFMLDALPRFTFQAVLPFLLTLVWVWRNRPGRWPWIMAMTGATVYIHPVSMPTWAAAIWLGLWLFLPREWPLKKKLGMMIGIGLITILAAAPFALNYLGSHAEVKSANSELVLFILQHHFPGDLLDVPAALAGFGEIAGRYGLLPLSILGAILLWIFRQGERTSLSLLALWAAGLLLITVAVPSMERLVERIFHLLPTETELMRGIRYFIPIFLLLCLWPLREISGRLKNQTAQKIAAALAAVMVIGWIATHPAVVAVAGKGLSCITRGNTGGCLAIAQPDPIVEVLRSSTPKGSKIYSSDGNLPGATFALPVRYLALRPLVFSYKDRASAGFSDDQWLSQWYEQYRNVDAIQSEEEASSRLRKSIQLALHMDADYLVFHESADPAWWSDLPVAPIYHSNEVTLLRLQK